jgi:hypothetical protein
VITICGRHYTATEQAPGGEISTWIIHRGRFEMGRFIGTLKEVTAELEAWDDTVISESNDDQ